MKRLLLVLAVLVVAVAATTKYRISSGVTDSLEMAKRGMAPFATLSYGDVTTTFGGTIEVRDISVDLHTENAQFSAERVAFVTGSPWVLLNLKETIENQKIPEQFRVEVDGLSVPSEVTDAWSGVESGKQDPYLRFQLAGCGGRTTLTRGERLASGYSDIKTDFAFGYRLLNSDMSIAIDLRSKVHDVADIQMEMVANLPHAINEKAISPDLANDAKLANATFTMTDLGDNQKILGFCADDASLTIAEYTTKHMEAWIAEWRRLGVVPSDTLIDVYRDYISNPGGTLTAKLEPYPSLELGDNYISPDPAYLSSRLNPQMGTKNTGMKPVSLTKVSLDDDHSPKEAPSELTVSNTAPTIQALPSAPFSGQIKVAALTDHLNHDVQITTTTGRRIDGRVLSVNQGIVNIQRHLHGGIMEMPLPMTDIRSVRLR